MAERNLTACDAAQIEKMVETARRESNIGVCSIEYISISRVHGFKMHLKPIDPYWRISTLSARARARLRDAHVE